MSDQNSNKYTYFVPDFENEDEERDKTALDNFQKEVKQEQKASKIITDKIKNHIWLNVSEAAQLAGVQTKTIRRAIKEKKDLRYKVVHNRYKVELRSLIAFMHSSTKLRNKLYRYGLGQYVTRWRKQ